MKNSLLFALAKARSPKLGSPSQERWLISPRHYSELTAWTSAEAPLEDFTLRKQPVSA